MRFKKWRDLTVDFNKINYKEFKIDEILSYPPAGNDVIECQITIQGKQEYAFIKYERSKVANFKTEADHLKKIHNILPCTPAVIEYGKYNNKDYLVLEKKNGSRLSEIFRRSVKYKKEYLLEYGKTLAQIHNIKNNNFKKALQRPINNIPDDHYTYDEYASKIKTWLVENLITLDYNTFIHGDFHYGNVLFKNKKISGILDMEYSGLGFKEQDIAWACILRPGQKFMNNTDDIKTFLEGYNTCGNFDYKKFKWCYINGSIHFYLMNKNNEEYKNNIKKMIHEIMRG